VIRNLLSTEILIVEKISNEEARQLEKKLELSELALQKFLSSQINLSDYLETLEMCQIDIDDYLLTIENNLSLVGIQ